MEFRQRLSAIESERKYGEFAGESEFIPV